MEAGLLPFGSSVCIHAEPGAFDHPRVRMELSRLQELGEDLFQHRAACGWQQARASDHCLCAVEAKDVCRAELVKAVHLETGCAADIPSQPAAENPGAEPMHFVDESALNFAFWILDGDDAHRANLPCVGDASRFAGAEEFDLLPKV